jgi:hypothetical protein
MYEPEADMKQVYVGPADLDATLFCGSVIRVTGT